MRKAPSGNYRKENCDDHYIIISLDGFQKENGGW
jgi:hypothetical protein